MVKIYKTVQAQIYTTLLSHTLAHFYEYLYKIPVTFTYTYAHTLVISTYNVLLSTSNLFTYFTLNFIFMNYSIFKLGGGDVSEKKAGFLTCHLE